MKRALLGLVLIVALTATARSYVTDTYGGNPVRWPNAVATVGHDASTITGAYVTELQAALAVWSNVSGSSFRFIHGGASQAANVKDSNNGSTDVYFDSSLPPFGYAVTMVNEPYTSADITERDIAFNANVSWKTSGTGSGTDFRTVAIHELGHVLGLKHETTNLSVMNVSSWDPTNARHSLETDDMNAVRYLYPGTNPGPDPDPDPVLTADLTIDSVTVTPEDAGPGDHVTIAYSVRNNGTADSGSFEVGAYLTGGLIPNTTDEFLGSDSESDLEIGASRAGSIGADIPLDLLPGRYRYGVLADTRGDVTERIETNNGNATLPLLLVDRPPVEIGPGQLVTGDLGPQGEDRFRIHLPAKASLRLRAHQDPGSLYLDVTQPGAPVKLYESGLTRGAKARVKVLEDGEYEIVLRSGSASTCEYEMLLKAKLKKVKGKQVVDSPDSPIRIPFRVYRGCTVKVVVQGRKGFAPTAEVEGESFETVAKKSKVKLGPWTSPENGERVLVIGAGPGMEGPGEVKYTVRVKPAAEEVTVRR